MVCRLGILLNKAISLMEIVPVGEILGTLIEPNFSDESD
jgi:hypothetical protein